MYLAKETSSIDTQQSYSQDSLLEAWRRHAAELRRHCLAWTGGNQGDAEEALSRVASSIFLKPLSRAHEIVDLRAWFLRLTYNACMDLHRERKRRGEQSFDDAGEDAEIHAPLLAARTRENPETSFLEAELAGYLRSCIRELPPKLRDALQMRMEQRSYSDIATRLSINEAAARKRVQLARQALQSQLREYLEGRSPTPARSASFTTGPTPRPSVERFQRLASARRRR